MTDFNIRNPVSTYIEWFANLKCQVISIEITCEHCEVLQISVSGAAYAEELRVTSDGHVKENCINMKNR